MRVVVTGGTGFIGKALVSALGQRGDQVTVLSRNPDAGRGALPAGVQAVEWHPTSDGTWQESVDGSDAVINLAGAPVVDPLKPWTAQRKVIIRASRVDSTRALIRAIEKATSRPSIMINQSAIGFYGSRGDVVLTETSPAGSDFLAGVVVDWEAAAAPATTLGVRLVLLRTANVLGHGGLLPQFELPFKLFFGGTMGNPGQWFSWIHIDDEVALMLYALDHDGLHGPVNASAPNPVTMDAFSRELGAALHRPAWMPFIGTGMKVMLGQRSEAVLASQRVVPAVAEQSGYLFRYPESGPALREFIRP